MWRLLRELRKISVIAFWSRLDLGWLLGPSSKGYISGNIVQKPVKFHLHAGKTLYYSNLAINGCSAKVKSLLRVENSKSANQLLLHTVVVPIEIHVFLSDIFPVRPVDASLCFFALFVNVIHL